MGEGMRDTAYNSALRDYDDNALGMAQVGAILAVADAIRDLVDAVRAMGEPPTTVPPPEPIAVTWTCNTCGRDNETTRDNCGECGRCGNCG